jgi:hypothetical protein
MKGALKLIVGISAVAVVVTPEEWARALHCLVVLTGLVGLDVHKRPQIPR